MSVKKYFILIILQSVSARPSRSAESSTFADISYETIPLNVNDKSESNGDNRGALSIIPGDTRLSRGVPPGTRHGQKDKDIISPISKMVYGSPDGSSSKNSPSGIPVLISAKNSPTPFFPLTPPPSYDMVNVKLPNKLSAAGNDSLPFQANRGLSTTPKNRNSTSTGSMKSHLKKPTEDPATTPVRRSSMNLSNSINKNKMSIVVPAVAVPLPLPSRVVKVAVRVRPFSQFEIESNARRIVSYCGNKMVIVNPAAFDADPDAIALAAATVECKEWAQVFLFNHVLW